MLSLTNEELFSKVRVISNRYRFKIIELTQNDNPSISSLSKKIGLSYTKCADYVTLLENNGLIQKERIGKETKVRSSIKLFRNGIEF
ncbi:winged helix-turn-helix transcriptional regulator [Candidatus Woesearchaeota archaeon]|nr:winged helix-turn-helix transcriptional regulator [Candidatus Woesearchaeota archaeon]